MLHKLNLIGRDQEEQHRTATSLELMFDLAAVIAVASAAHGLHHAILGGHILDGVWGFFFSFFMIWIAWANYTWFASAYDDGSPTFQGLSMVIMFGYLVLAAGIPEVFSGESVVLALIGFIIMRIPLILLWLSVAKTNASQKVTAYRYAVGLFFSQIAWIFAVLLIPPDSFTMKIAFLFGILVEFFIYFFAEKNAKTQWHRDHILERHGLFLIIVLGECFLASVLVMKTGITESGKLLIPLMLGAVTTVLVFSLWSLYFSQQEKYLPTPITLKKALLWGYGHFPLLGSVAAIGAGLTLLIENAIHPTQSLATISSLSVAIPIAIYLLSLWLVRDFQLMTSDRNWLFPLSALCVVGLGSSLTGAESLLSITLVLVLCVFFRGYRTSGKEG